MQKDEVYALMFEIMQKILYEVPLTRDVFDKGLRSPLTGNYWNLGATQLIYLFCETENKFGIRFEPKHLINYRFNTIQKIIDHVVNLLPTSNYK